MGGAGGGGGGGGGTGGDRTGRETVDLGSDKAVSLSVRSASPDAPSTASSRARNTSRASSVNVQSPVIEFNTVLLLASVSATYNTLVVSLGHCLSSQIPPRVLQQAKPKSRPRSSANGYAPFRRIPIRRKPV